LNLYLITQNVVGGDDQNAGHVVAAPDALVARDVAARSTASEPKEVWLSSAYSTITWIGTGDPRNPEPRIILTDYQE